MILQMIAKDEFSAIVPRWCNAFWLCCFIICPLCNVDAAVVVHPVTVRQHKIMPQAQQHIWMMRPYYCTVPCGTVHCLLKRNSLISDANKNTTEHQCDAITYNRMPILKRSEIEKGMMKEVMRVNGDNSTSLWADLTSWKSRGNVMSE